MFNLSIGILIGSNINYFQPFYTLKFNNTTIYKADIEITTEDNVKHLISLDEKLQKGIKIYNTGETEFSFKIKLNDKIIEYPSTYIDGNQNKTINIFNNKVEVENN